MDILGGSSQEWTGFGGLFYALKVNVQNGDIFLGLLKFQIVFGVCLIIQIFFW